MNTTIFTEIDWAAKIDERLTELGADTSHCAYSGLTAENVDGSEAVVKIFDDYDGGQYYADQVLECLKDLEPIDWSNPATANTETAFGPIWDSISAALV